MEQQLLISSKTVSTHKANIMAKLNVGSLIEMVDYARRHQLVW
jgi:two-component system response regulator EvgA